MTAHFQILTRYEFYDWLTFLQLSFHEIILSMFTCYCGDEV